MAEPIRVFLSSTWLDLQEERKAVEDILHRLQDVDFNGMEYFGSRPDTPRDASLAEVDRSHLFIGIFGRRYGSGLSEDEYRRALARELPCLIYILSEDPGVADDSSAEDAELVARRRALINELKARHIVTLFSDAKDLKAKVAPDLLRELSRLRLHTTDPSSRFTTTARVNTLPAPPGDFTGRASELVEIEHSAAREGAFIFGLRGLGGVGKTALALVVAHRLASRYPDAALYVNLRGNSRTPLTVRDAQIAVIRQLQPTAVIPDDPEQLGDLYKATLSNGAGLLLLDAARDAAQVRPLLPPPSWALLVTSRLHFPLPNLRHVDLATLPEDDAQLLLTRIAPRLTGQEADRIARLCGWLPLALCLAGSFLQTHRSTPAQSVIRLLEDETRRIKHLDESLRLNPDEPGMEATLRLSYGRLPRELQARWRALAVFPSSFSAEAAAAIWDLLPLRSTGSDRSQLVGIIDQAIRLLGTLCQHSLVDDDQTGRYRLHDLVRLFARRVAGADEGAATALRHSRHFLGVVRASEAEFLRGGDGVVKGLALLDREWSNVIDAHAWAVAQASIDASAAQLSIEYPIAGQHVLNLRQHPTERVHWLEAAAYNARSLRDSAFRQLGDALGAIGHAYRQVGDARRAITQNQQALKIAQEIPDRSREAQHLENLGLAHADLGETDRAIECYERALTVAREIGDRRLEGRCLGSLGTAYLDLGAASKAIDYERQTLVIARDVGDRWAEARCLATLGSAHTALGHTDEAAACYREALAISRETGDRRREGSCLGNLGLVYAELGESDLAIDHHQQALAIAQELGDRRREGRNVCHLGLCYLELGDVRKAIDHFQRARTIASKISDRRGEAHALGNFGRAIAAIGQNVGMAVECCRQSLTISREIGDRRGEHLALVNLGLVDAATGRFSRAVEYFHQAIAVADALDDRRGMGRTYFKLALAQYRSGTILAAIESADQALAILEPVKDREVNAVRERLDTWRAEVG